MSSMNLPSEGSVSEWNEAMFKMKRLHELQTEINICKMDLTGRHRSLNQWNYEGWLNAVIGLFDEGKAKYKVDEICQVKSIKELAERLLLTNPPHKHVSSLQGGSVIMQQQLNRENFERFKKVVEILETDVKLYNDKHGLSTKNQENIDGRSILR